MAGLKLWYMIDCGMGHRTEYATNRLRQWVYGSDTEVVGRVAEDIVQEHIGEDKDVDEVYQVFLFESDQPDATPRYVVPVYTKKIVVCVSGVVSPRW